MTVWALAGAVLAAVWLQHVLGAALGMPKIADVGSSEWDLDARQIGNDCTEPPKITIVVPARNEARTIVPALRSLRRLDYPNYEVVVVNDRSTDETGELMEQVASESAPGDSRVRVVHVRELPAGWLGKTHAMWVGANASEGDWILFTDADVVFRPDALRRVLAYAEVENADHVVLFPTMVTVSAGERMMIALFQALIGFGHRPWKVADPKARDFIGVGAFNMVRRTVYEAIGTYERMKLSIIDDMRLGELVKKNGYAQRNVFGRDLISIHWARGAFGIVHNLTKNFFAYVRFSWVLAVGAALGMLFLNVMPFLGIWFAPGLAKAGFAISIACIGAIYAGLSRMSGIPIYYIITHPIGSALLAYAILRSAFLTMMRGGVLWRGTVYSLEELRKG